MIPEVSACIRKFIPNDHRLAEKIYKVCDHVFHARFLPLQLVKMIVNKALEMKRQDIDIENRVFSEKLVEFATAQRPRFASQIMEIRRGNRR